ncbi:golgin [Tanacetum coccineum]
MKNLATMASGVSVDENDEDQASKLAFASYQAREEEIEKRKMMVKEKVEKKLGRAEEETRRLAQVWEELEVLADPMRKEVATVRKKIDVANREVKSLGQSCQKKEKEYKELLEAFHQKNNEKNQLTARLMELIKESENVRMKKLEELSKNIDPSC